MVKQVGKVTGRVAEYNGIFQIDYVDEAGMWIEKSELFETRLEAQEALDIENYKADLDKMWKDKRDPTELVSFVKDIQVNNRVRDQLYRHIDYIGDTDY